jgi:hypothetical protein
MRQRRPTLAALIGIPVTAFLAALVGLAISLNSDPSGSGIAWFLAFPLMAPIATYLLTLRRGQPKRIALAYALLTVAVIALLIVALVRFAHGN